MTHRERILTALSHRAPDRCPLYASFTPEFAVRLREALGIRLGSHHNPHGGGNTYQLERALDFDMLLTSVGWANGYYANETYNPSGGALRRPGQGSYTDEWGVTWRNTSYTTRFGGGFYTEMVGCPLADESAITGYRVPDPDRPELYADAERMIRELRDEYWIVGATVTTIFETAWALRGYERLLMDFVTDPDLADAVLDIPFRYHLRAAERLVRLGVDMIWIGDDVGGQNAMIMSPETWRRFLKPRMARFIAAIKAINPALKVAYHSDGWFHGIIGELIEVGVDVLNPIQSRSMDPAMLKRDFGDRLCFWGSVDEQHTLPFGTPADVKAEVRLRLETLGKGGGLILAPSQHVQLDTPVENFLAMVEAVRETPCS
jgi:uroporphyrinogen decarboxylase